MAKVFTLEPNPRWVIIDDFSKLPNGAAIYTFRHLNPIQFKPAFQDAAGTIPYGQPIVGFGNGTMPPIFWEFDDAAPEETYYIEVWSAPKDQLGVLLWTFDGLSGGTSGGGGNVTTTNDIENMVINGEFYNNCGNLPVTGTSVPTFVTLAPGANASIGGYANLASDGPPAPDIIFAKATNTDTDTLTFEKVSPIGSNNLAGGNPTPQYFVDYNCLAPGAGMTYKFIQIPILKGVQNLSGITVSVSIYARLVSGPTDGCTISIRQFFGNGGNPSPDVVTIVSGGAIDLDLGNWKKIDLLAQVIPSVAGKSLGLCENDAVYLQINFPHNNAFHMQFTLPAMYLGDKVPIFNFKSFDEVDPYITRPRTGDIRQSLAPAQLGWLAMNDGTIGTLDIFGTSNATARANTDTFQLFDLIWRTFITNQVLAPMRDNGGTVIPYGGSSFADFVAHNQITLTRNLGRVMAGTLPTQLTQPFTTPVANTITVPSTALLITGTPVTVSGSTVPALINGVTYFLNISSPTTAFIYRTSNEAINDVNRILFPANGALGGSLIFPAHALGSFIGDETHLQTIAEMPTHNHTVGGGVGTFVVDDVAGPVVLEFTGTNTALVPNTDNTGGNNRMTIMQPTVFMNTFIKL